MAKVWLVTGASRGIGSEIAKAALSAGHKVVATARQVEQVKIALGHSDHLLAAPLDVSVESQAEAAVNAAMERFERIDVLVNNAGGALMGAFEECRAEDWRGLFDVNVFGVAAVTRAVLPVMRAQRSGHIFNLSSMAGIAGFPGASAYCATKFAIEGFSESLFHEVAPLGIKVTIVEPGYFRTGLLSKASMLYSENRIDDYDATAGEARRMSQLMDGQQPGDPEMLAKAILALEASSAPPLRYNAGEDAAALSEQILSGRQKEIEEWRSKSASLFSDH